MNKKNTSIKDNFLNSNINLEKKLENFTRFVGRRDIATFLNRNEIYKKIVNVHGCIIDCGVNLGSSLFTWLHLRNIYEPYNSSRQIYGFDTFDGFKSMNIKDRGGIYLDKKKFKDFNKNQSINEISNALEFHESQQVTKHLPSTLLIKGDSTKTIPIFIKKNPHVFVSLLHLDFDIYMPTKIALKYFITRMSKGSIIAFDELGCAEGPGVTLACLEELNIKNYKVHRNYFDSFLSFVEL